MGCHPPATALSREQPAGAEQVGDGCVPARIEQRRGGEQELSGGQGVPKSVVPAVLGQPKLGGSRTQPNMRLDKRAAAPGDHQSGQQVSVDEPPRLITDATQPPAEKGALDLRDVSDEDAVPEVGDQVDGDLLGSTRLRSIHRSDAVNHDGSRVRGHLRANRRVER